LRSFARRGVRTSVEARNFLDRAGVPLTQADQLITALKSEGLLDDAACAKLWADHWARAGWAAWAIREKIFQKGLGQPDIELALEALSLKEGDEARAREWVASRKHKTASRTARCRALAARGFEPELIRRVLGSRDEEAPSE
jgi:SOS response regulatory protein OraA/RecX